MVNIVLRGLVSNCSRHDKTTVLPRRSRLVLAAVLFEGQDRGTFGVTPPESDIRSADTRGICGLIIGLHLTLAFRPHPRFVVRDFALSSFFIPFENVREDLCRRLGGEGASIEGFDRNPGAPGQYVIEMERALV